MDLAAYYTEGPGGCWLWRLAISSGGYGRKKSSGRTLVAHRWVYEQVVGAIPKGAHLHHICENKRCVNPDHLVPVDPGQHIRGHRLQTHCKRGHEFTPENTYWPPSGSTSRQCRACWESRARERGVEKGRHGPKPKTHCKRGHAYTPENTRVYGRRRFCIACEKVRRQP